MMPGQSESAAETCDETGLPARAAGSPLGRPPVAQGRCRPTTCRRRLKIPQVGGRKFPPRMGGRLTVSSDWCSIEAGR
jgi:hypothetical protein